MTCRVGAIGLSFVLLALAGTGAAEENKPLDPAVVLGLVQSFYDQTKTLQAEFEQTRYTQLYDRYDRATGKVVFKKPGMMRWDYAQPNGQVFVSNGKKLLIYQPPEEGEKRKKTSKSGSSSTTTRSSKMATSCSSSREGLHPTTSNWCSTCAR
jgi:outer membrane lipoprotein carrier protein